jgi:CheY-like chemotaxis protein
MPNALPGLHRSQEVMQRSARFMNRVASRLEPSRVVVACGKACAEARTRATVTDEAPLKRDEQLHEAPRDAWSSRLDVSSSGGTMTPQTPLTILVIDDELSITNGLAQLLRRDGGTVDIAANGHLALAHIQKQRYDVVLCDLRMPGLDGPDFYAILSRQHAYLRHRVLFLTGDTLGADSTAFLAQCGQPWLPKPCTAAEVRSAIQQMLQAVEGSV